MNANPSGDARLARDIARWRGEGHRLLRRVMALRAKSPTVDRQRVIRRLLVLARDTFAVTARLVLVHRERSQPRVWKPREQPERAWVDTELDVEWTTPEVEIGVA